MDRRNRRASRLIAACFGLAGAAAIAASMLVGAGGSAVPGQARAAAHLADTRYEHGHAESGKDRGEQAEVAVRIPEQPPHKPDRSDRRQPAKHRSASRHTQAHPKQPHSEDQHSKHPAQRKHAPAGPRPGTIRLPRGGTARLVRSEVTAHGTLPVPNGVREATWWGAGLDAKRGASVFAGHVNWAGRTGPFDELWRDGKGDVVTVADTAGKQHRYRIRKVVTVHKNGLPAKAGALFGQRGPHRAVLVTCGGRWVGGDEGYASNRIVLADPV